MTLVEQLRAVFDDIVATSDSFGWDEHGEVWWEGNPVIHQGQIVDQELAGRFLEHLTGGRQETEKGPK